MKNRLCFTLSAGCIIVNATNWILLVHILAQMLYRVCESMCDVR